jgi:hypothetical protein
MKTPIELEAIRAEAIARLDAAATTNHILLLSGKVHPCKWMETAGGLMTKVGRGTLTVYTENLGFPGICYTSSYGANSDDSYSGFIPGVSFEEALLLVWDKHQKQLHRGE